MTDVQAAAARLQANLAELARRDRRNKLVRYAAYPKQREFHAAGATHRERLLMASNQSGKSYCGSAEVAIHLTGRYPSWWQGRRWNRPIRAWAGSESAKTTRDGVQRLLIGDPADQAAWGEGLIPGDDIVRVRLAQGIANALDTITVKHASGGNSTLGFKSYEQGRRMWQAETLDLIHFDEEPPEDIYIEGLTRTNATEGMVFLTFTPLLGWSTVVERFLGTNT